MEKITNNHVAMPPKKPAPPPAPAPQKPAPQNTQVKQKQKSATKKKKKLWLWICCAIVLIALVVVVTILATKAEKLTTPHGLFAQTLPNGSVIVQVDKNSSAEKYEFVINQVGQNAITYTTTANGFDAKTIMATAGSYQIKCRYLGKENNNHSEYSKTITFNRTFTLATPTISLIEENNKTKLQVSSYNEITANINYTITLTYVSGEVLKTATVTPTTNSNGIIVGYFNLTDIITEKGTYTLSAKISTDNEFYLTSDMSQTVNFTVN